VPETEDVTLLQRRINDITDCYNETANYLKAEREGVSRLRRDLSNMTAERDDFGRRLQEEVDKRY